MFTQHIRKKEVQKIFPNHLDKHFYFLVLALCRFLVLFFISTRAECEVLPFVIDLQDGQLSVTAEGIPLSIILKEISLKAGIEMRGIDDLKESVSVKFSCVSLARGLKKLLVRVNHFIVEKETSPFGATEPVLVVIIGGRTIRENDMYSEILANNENQLFEYELLSNELQQEEEILIRELQRAEEQLRNER